MVVGIFTTFRDFDSSYSLVSVVRDQLVMHVKNGYETVLFVLPEFEGEVPDGVEVRKVIPAIIIEPYKGTQFPETWQKDADEVKKALEEHAMDIDIAITHDWVFIDTYIPYNIGMRESKMKAKKFHWVHSAPSPRPELKDNPHANRYEMPPNSKLVYLNNDKALALAEMYGTWLKNVRVVHNSIDPRTFWNLSDFTNGLIDKYDLLSADITSIYPLSTPRMVDGKQINVVIRIHAELKKLGYTTRLIIPNAHCNAEPEKKMVKNMMDLARDHGLTPYEVIFTSNEGYEMGIPREHISELFRLSNVFIFPSFSENCSLVLLEAMCSGNLLVLNKGCSGLQEFGGTNAIYFDFGKEDSGQRTSINYTDNNFSDYAKIIRSEMEVNKPLKARVAAMKRFNLDSTFKQIEAMYYEQ